jgi:hypothetical protein
VRGNNDLVRFHRSSHMSETEPSAALTEVSVWESRLYLHLYKRR